MLHEMRGGVTGGSVVAWDHKLYSPTHNSRPNSGNSAGNLLAAQHAGILQPADMPALGTNTQSRNGPITYNFSNRRLNRNWVKSYNGTPSGSGAATVLKPPALPTQATWVLPRTTALRSLGGVSNTFANESFTDELAKLCNANPLDFRLAHTSDGRAQAVLNAVKAHSLWSSPKPTAPAGFAYGRGVSFLRYETVEAYVAMAVEVLVTVATGAVKVTRVVVAHDCGQIVNPDGLRNQIEGNVIQGISRALKEQVDYTGDHVNNNGWVDFPAFFAVAYSVLQFDEVPSIDVILLNQPSATLWGAGEPTIGGVPAAVGNAICDAIGVRVRTLPMRPATVLAASA
jgi:CO/xanthine dehydrogenase Mo-binding subunit